MIVRPRTRRYVVLLIGLLLMLTAGATPPARAAPTPATDRAWLETFAERERTRSRRAYERARKVAERKGWPLRTVGADGALYVLVRLDERGAPVYYETHNLGAAETVSTDHVWPSTEPGGQKIGLDLSGGGETVGIWDAGAIFEHSEFGGRVTWSDDTNPDTSDHATHVAGTMIAEGLEARAHGMAHELKLLGWDFVDDDPEMADSAAAGLRASNHSYGFITGWAKGTFCASSDTWTWFGNTDVSGTEDYRFGFYGAGARQWDAIAHNAPRYLIVQSAGNDRDDRPPNDGADGHWYFPNQPFDETDCTFSTETRRPDGEKESVGWRTNAKNVLAVGAVEEIPGGYEQASDVSIASFSSFGPTDDGRIKPELVAKGVGTHSTVTGDAYDTFDGTSMAAPNVTGSVGLLLELHRSLHGTPPLASTMRAVLIHTADTAGGHPSPDYTYGWGLLNTSRAADLIRRDAGADSPLIHELEVTEGTTMEVDFEVTTPDSPVKVTLAWTDPPGTPPAKSLDPPDTMLVNNLDLRVITPGGSTLLPWVPNGDGVSDTVLPQGDNNLSINEQVLLPAPVDTGTYTARVSLGNRLPGTQTQVASLVIGDSSALRLTSGGSGGGGGGGGSCLLERAGTPAVLLEALRGRRDDAFATRAGRWFGAIYYRWFTARSEDPLEVENP